MPATSVEEAVYNKLQADSAFITAITALYWRQAPAGASLPYVVYFQVDDPRPKELLSYYGGEARLQLSVFADDASAGLLMSQTVVEKVRDIRGTQNGLRLTGTVANVLTQPANVDGIFHRTVDVIVRYTEEA
jgi:regulator of protease activity HflC (stomatin/prohibitin superfamily)